jgi:hypothetical protein
MRRLIALALIATVVVVLVVAQLVLPGIAAQRIRDQLNRSGHVLSVSVHAVPAVELLWHHADRVTIRLGAYRADTAGLDGSLSQSGDVGSLDATATTVRIGLLRLHDGALRKRGDRLTGSATITEADLRAAVPILQSVTPIASSGGQLTLRGRASLLGLGATVDATVRAQDGKLVISPDVPLGGLATITVFSDPRVSVRSVAATRAPGGFSVHATGVVR